MLIYVVSKIGKIISAISVHQVITTLDKDEGYIEAQHCRLTKYSEMKASSSEVKKYRLTPETSVSVVCVPTLYRVSYYAFKLALKSGGTTNMYESADPETADLVEKIVREFLCIPGDS